MKALMSTVVALVIGCSVTYGLTIHLEKEKFQAMYEKGVEAGRGQLKELVSGTGYELRLVGIPLIGPSEAYRMEGLAVSTYGSAQQEVKLPKDFKEGDRVVFTALNGFEKLP